MHTLHCGCPSSHLTRRMSAESQLGREMSHSPFRLCTQQKEIQINKLPCFAGKKKGSLTRHVLESISWGSLIRSQLTYQQPVRDRGGRRIRGGAIRPLSALLKASANKSSLGAMIGSRRGGFPETLLRRFCITRLVTVIRLTGYLEGDTIRDQ